jgi:hypothetical protein
MMMRNRREEKRRRERCMEVEQNEEDNEEDDDGKRCQGQTTATTTTPEGRSQMGESARTAQLRPKWLQSTGKGRDTKASGAREEVDLGREAQEAQ